MPFFQVVLFVCILIGIALVLFSLYLFIKRADDPHTQTPNAAETVTAIESAVRQIDQSMEELNDITKVLFDELNEKHQELLFLYALIDGKKTETAAQYTSKIDKIPHKKQKSSPKARLIENPRWRQIQALLAEGLPVSEIAKKLEMGQGEVKLMIELIGKA